MSSLGGNKYVLVIVDDFSRYTWTLFLCHKNQTIGLFSKFSKRVQNELELKITKIRSDHSGEFKNEKFENFCDELGIIHNFSTPRIPQQNGIVERKNKTL